MLKTSFGLWASHFRSAFHFVRRGRGSWTVARVLTPFLLATLAPAGSAANSGQITGKVYADLGNGIDPVALPDIELYLKDAATGRAGSKVKTDLTGIYSFQRQEARSYQICWNAAGWVPGCSDETVHVESQRVAAQDILIKPELRAGANSGPALGPLYGRVELRDGTVCNGSSSLFGISTNSSAVVTALGHNGRVLGGPVRTNSEGEYVLVAVPIMPLKISASCQGITSALSEPARESSAALALRGTKETLVVIGNSRPVISYVVARVGSSEVTIAPPGSTVQLIATAKDPDGNPLTYRWKAEGGRIAPSAKSQTSWIVPATPGRYGAFVLTSDGHGGIAEGSVWLSVGVASTPVATQHSGLARVGTVAPSSFLCGDTSLPQWSGYPTSIFFTRKGANRPPAAAEMLAYYNVIDPQASRRTLDNWKAKNGFPNGEVRAAYLNRNDLGFGRDMHCRQDTSDLQDPYIACYVTNYGAPDQNPSNADDAVNQDAKTRLATVTMEYRKIESQASPIVKFFVYGPDGSIVTDGADLDNQGQRPIPQLCTVCHGSNTYQPNDYLHPTLADVDLQASFREFDLESFGYSSIAGWSRKDQEANFKKLNQMVAASNPSAAIKDLITGWYTGNGATQDSTYIPNGWKTDPSGHPYEPPVSDLYSKVVGKSCRTCHVALSPNLNWMDYPTLQKRRLTVNSLVCKQSKAMPHACTTYRNFWTDNQRLAPQTLANFSNSDWASFTTCQ